MLRGELALGDIVSDTSRIAFCRIAPASCSAKDVPKHVVSPDHKPTFRGQFALLTVAPQQVHRGRAVAASLQAVGHAHTTVGAQLQYSFLGKELVAYFGQQHGVRATPVLSRFALDREEPRDGPLLIDEYDATTLVPPGSSVRLDHFNNILIRIEA